jgi:hypothetical protein
MRRPLVALFRPTISKRYLTRNSSRRLYSGRNAGANRNRASAKKPSLIPVRPRAQAIPLKKEALRSPESFCHLWKKSITALNSLSKVIQVCRVITLLSRVHFESMIEGFRVIRKDGMGRRFSGLRENEALSQLSYTPTAVLAILGRRQFSRFSV